MLFDIGIKDVIDILLTAVILFYFYKVMRETRSVRVFTGVLVFVSFWIVISKVLEMKLLGSILDQLINVGAIALIVLFQSEIRHFFYSIGTHDRFGRVIRYLRPSRKKQGEFRHERSDIFPIVMACLNMAKQKVGALIVLQNDLPLGDFIDTGEKIDARASQRLIENIFFKNSPLHDGAMIVRDGRIVAAACIMPTSHDLDIPKEFGLRHRAAKGTSTETDALSIVVSEETGGITAAYRGKFKMHVTSEELEDMLMRGEF
ncbi:MAG: diadenylate cyclase CdaA [Bacteroidaceae bacterium]|nr:diadenylate cyclase CdaA [Bacteroidaceae bacterium]